MRDKLAFNEVDVDSNIGDYFFGNEAVCAASHLRALRKPIVASGPFVICLQRFLYLFWNQFPPEPHWIFFMCNEKTGAMSPSLQPIIKQVRCSSLYLTFFLRPLFLQLVGSTESFMRSSYGARIALISTFQVFCVYVNISGIFSLKLFITSTKVCRC